MTKDRLWWFRYLVERVVLRAWDLLMWPNTHWRQWRIDRMESQLADRQQRQAVLERLRQGHKKATVVMEMEQLALRDRLSELGIDPDQ